MIENPTERLKMYSEGVGPDGKLKINVQALMQDLIAVAKLDGVDIKLVQSSITDLWDTVVIYTPPTEARH